MNPLNTGTYSLRLAHVLILFSLAVRLILAMPATAMEAFEADDLDNYPAESTLSYANDGHLTQGTGHQKVFQRSDGVFGKLDNLRMKYEGERLDTAFRNLDDLMGQAVIKYQSIKQEGVLGREIISNLHQFLSGPHDIAAIEKIITKSLHRNLSETEIKLFEGHDNISFSKAVRILWKNNVIKEKHAQKLLMENSPLTPEELIRLLENGSAQTAKGQMVYLRTGGTYGDVLKLFNDISEIVTRVKNSEILKAHEIPFMKLREKPLPPEILDIFLEVDLRPEETIDDAYVIREMREHFLFLNSLSMPTNYFNPNLHGFNISSADSPLEPVNTVNSIDYVISPETMSASIVGNYYFSNINASTTHGLYVNPLGITYAGMLTFEGSGLDWWLNYTSGFLGVGMNYTTTFDQGTFWSNGQPTYLNVGLMAGGWRNYLTAGLSLSTVLANGIGIGASATMTVTRSHDITYLGIEPLDHMYSQIRGMHKIEIDDVKGVAANATVAANFSAVDVPVTVAFRAGVEHTTKRIYRTHVDLEKTQRMLSEANVPGVLFLLGKKIKETRVPKFENPETLIDGDELVETKIGKLTGAFVVGLESIVPIHALRVGAAIELTAEYELGLKKYPYNKYEVSIQPKRVYEMGLFTSILNIMGAGHIKSLAMARKQIFAFDFNVPEAVVAYYDLIHHGRLPISEEIPIHTESHGPEYLLNDFRVQNEQMASRGVARTYLEKIDIATNKWHAGIDVPVLPAILDIVNKIDKETRPAKERLDLQFAGIHREFMTAESKSLATNGITAIRRSTFGGRKSKGQGFSGTYNEDVFVTHERVHSLDNLAGVSTWAFNRLVVHAQLEDTRITGDEENSMVNHINELFSTFIGSFEVKNSKSPRTINIERAFTSNDFLTLTLSECRERVSLAAQKSGIDQQRIFALLRRLDTRHPDYQGLVVKHFIETSHGFSGFAAIHQLLGARPDQIYIRTESGYADEIVKAKTFIAKYSNVEKSNEKTSFVNLTAWPVKKNKKHAKHFYQEGHVRLREIDDQLRLLYDDRILIDDESPLLKFYPEKKVKQLVLEGKRQDKTPYRTALGSARKTILEMRDLDAQGILPQDQTIIYKMAGKKRLGIREHAKILLTKYEAIPMSAKLSKDHLRKRFERCHDMISKLNDRISQLENDKVMYVMDENYVSNSIRDFSQMRHRLAEVISVKHLAFEQKELIRIKLLPKKRFKMFRSKKRFVPEGAFAEAFDDCNANEKKYPDQQDVVSDLRSSCDSFIDGEPLTEEY